MPITVPNTAAITAAVQAMLNSQKTALDTTINAARDNVKSDNVTQIGAQTTSITNAVTAARDDVKANTDSNRATVTGWVTAAQNNIQSTVNAKGVVKSIQRINWNNSASTVTIAAVVPAKTVIVLDAIVQQGGTGTSASASVLNATTIQVYASVSCSAQVVEYF